MKRPRLSILLGLAAALAILAGWYGLDALTKARSRLASLERMIDSGSRAGPPLMSAGAFAGRDRAAAAVRFSRRLSEAAAAQRLLVERIEVQRAEPDYPALISAHLALSGGEAEVVRFVRSLEADMPTIRFAAWHIGRAAPGERSVRFEGRAIALWKQAR